MRPAEEGQDEEDGAEDIDEEDQSTLDDHEELRLAYLLLRWDVGCFLTTSSYPGSKTSHWVGCWKKMKNLQECFNNTNNMGPDPGNTHSLSEGGQGQAQGSQA